MAEVRTFVRFVTHVRDDDSQELQGVFQAAAALMESPELDPACRAWGADLMRWFSEHLPRPTRFAASKRHNAPERALSWFRDTAQKHLATARSLVALLELNGIEVIELRTARPGYVLYEICSKWSRCHSARSSEPSILGNPRQGAHMPVAPDDWRLAVATDYFEGSTWTFKPYRMPSPDWDHDHCRFCFARFMEPGTPNVLHAGYANADENWLCPECFADFREMFGWTETAPGP